MESRPTGLYDARVGTRTSHARSPEETRGRILRAAFEEFYRHGYQGGSLNRIIEESGTTKGALFHHFQGKGDLGKAVLEEVIRPSIRASWLEPLADTDDPIAEVKRTVRGFAKRGSESGRLLHGCPLNNLAQEMSPLDEEFRRRIEAIYAEWRGTLERAFARGREAGTVREDASPRNVAAFVVAALAGMIGTAKNSQSEALLKQAGGAFFDYLDGLRP